MNSYVKSKLVYVLIGFILFMIIVWVVWGTRNTEVESDVTVNQETYTMEAAVQSNSEQSTEASKGYYMVKSDGESVKVYWIDGTGEHLYRETTIPFSLLSSEDQEMLLQGVRIESDEELADFLENYDS